jgi:hypothetical protein
MKQSILMATVALLALFSCKSPQITLSPDLNAEAMSAKGRNGFTFGQTIEFGAYATSKVRRGWTQSYNIPFVLRFQGAKEKLSFVQYGPNGQLAQVSCVGRFKSIEVPLIGEYFGIPIEFSHFFAGNISISTMNWDFVVHNPNGDFLREKPSAGFAQCGSNRIEIRAVRALEGQPHWMKKLTVYGHEFVLGGKTVGAVSTINNGKVWIDASLDAPTRTVIAALASGLLLRTDVESADSQASR